jgi:hypothetical protein
MRIEPSPQAVLSGNGYLAAIVQATKVILIETRTGSTRDLILPHEGTLVAFDPQASLMAVSGDRQLSLFQSVDNPQLLSTSPIAAWLDRLAVGEDGLVVGVARFDDRETSQLFAWRGPQLRPLFAETGQSLGPVALDGLLVDGPANRALYWGLQSNEMGFEAAFYGEGQPFVRLVSLEAEGSLRQLWAGEDAPAEPNGFLLPLAGGQLGAYSRETLVVFAPEVGATGSWQPIRRYDWGDLETVAASPNGVYLAWLWSSWDGQRDHHHLRVAALQGNLIDEVIFEILGDFPALAVDNHGQATLVFSADKSRVIALTLEQGRLIKRADIAVNDWPG